MKNNNGLYLCIDWEGYYFKKGKLYIVENNKIKTEPCYNNKSEILNFSDVRNSELNFKKIDKKLAKLLYEYE